MNEIPSPIVVQTKPGADVWAYHKEWTHKLFRCCDEPDICCLMYLLYPCRTYDIYKRSGEKCLACCWPMTLWSLRTKMRTLFRIQGSMCDDCAAAYCCPFCTLVQMHFELTRHGL